MPSGYDDTPGYPDAEWKCFRHPHSHVRYFWYDVYRWSYTDWYQYRETDFVTPNGTVPAGSYYYSEWKKGSTASTAD